MLQETLGPLKHISFNFDMLFKKTIRKVHLPFSQRWEYGKWTIQNIYNKTIQSWLNLFVEASVISKNCL